MLLCEATQHGEALLALYRKGRWYLSTDMGPNDPWRTMALNNLDACFAMGPFRDLDGMSFDELCEAGVELGHMVWRSNNP